jgi:tetratricopeptide (TPR) repeat protein
VTPAPDAYDSAAMKRRASAPDPSLVRAGLLPASLVVVFLLMVVVELPFWLAALASVPFVALFVVAPYWARASARRLDRDIAHLLATDQRDRLEGRLSVAVGLRLFAPPAAIAERRGLVEAELGRPGSARRAFKRALEAWEEPDDAPMAVHLGYAHASYSLGDDPEAIASYRRVLVRSGALPGVRRRLAHALARRGEALPEALELLDHAEKETGDANVLGEIALIRALAEARRGNRATAKRLTRAVREVSTETAERIREELRAELGRGRKR